MSNISAHFQLIAKIKYANLSGIAIDVGSRGSELWLGGAWVLNHGFSKFRELNLQQAAFTQQCFELLAKGPAGNLAGVHLYTAIRQSESQLE